MFVGDLRHDDNLTACNCRECNATEEENRITVTGRFDDYEPILIDEPKQKFTASGKKKKRGF